MNFRKIIQMAVVTAGCMFLANMLAAMSPGARKLFKGSVVTPVTTNAAPSSGSIAV